MEKRYIKDRDRSNTLFVPGNSPGRIAASQNSAFDCVIFDLYSSVALAEKDSARFLVYYALKSLQFGEKELTVQINPFADGNGTADLEAIIPAGVHVVRLPKTKCAQDIIDCEKEMARIEAAHGIPVGSTGIMAAIDLSGGIMNALEIARASERLVGIAPDIQGESSDLLSARGTLLSAARSAGIAALDPICCDTRK